MMALSGPKTLEEVAVWADKEVRRITYPNYEFEVEAQEERLWLFLFATVEDSVNPGNIVKVAGSKEIWWKSIIRDPSLKWMILYGAVWQVIEDFENHERMELLRVNGVSIYDPHPLNADGTLGTRRYPDLTNPRVPEEVEVE